MPELPEVETVVRGLRPDLVGRRIDGMWYDWERSIATPAPDIFAQRVVGQQVKSVERRAKYIVIELDHDYLLVHLKMTGRLYVVDQHTHVDADRWVHVKFGLDAGYELRFSDSRKFGRVYLAQDLTDIVGTLGPEPLSEAFTLAVFQERLTHYHRAIKPLLLDQTFLAGVGNIYADESLFRAKIHPKRLSSDLRADEISVLYQMIRTVLQDGVTHEGASINWYRKADGSKGTSQEHFFAYGRDGLPCLVCGSTIEKLWVAQRGTHICPNCQPLKG